MRIQVRRWRKARVEIGKDLFPVEAGADLHARTLRIRDVLQGRLIHPGRRNVRDSKEPLSLSLLEQASNCGHVPDNFLVVAVIAVQIDEVVGHEPRDARAREGGRVSCALPFDGDGITRWDQQLTDGARVVALMRVNHETGAIQPVVPPAAWRWHCDAAQAVGKLPFSANDLEVDLLTIVGHKLYAPKGVGALYVRQGTPLEPLIPGGDQEQGRRAGTENVALLVALGCGLTAMALGRGQRLRLPGWEGKSAEMALPAATRR